MFASGLSFPVRDFSISYCSCLRWNYYCLSSVHLDFRPFFWWRSAIGGFNFIYSVEYEKDELQLRALSFYLKGKLGFSGFYINLQPVKQLLTFENCWVIWEN